MIVFFILMFMLGALSGAGAVLLVVAGDRYDQQHPHARALDALEAIWERS